MEEIVTVTAGLPKLGGNDILVICDAGEEEMLRRINAVIEEAFNAFGKEINRLGDFVLVTPDGCFKIKNASDPERETKLVPTEVMITDQFVAASIAAKQKSVLNVLSEKPRFNGRRSKGDRVRNRKEWRSKWRK